MEKRKRHGGNMKIINFINNCTIGKPVYQGVSIVTGKPGEHVSGD